MHMWSSFIETSDELSVKRRATDVGLHACRILAERVSTNVEDFNIMFHRTEHLAMSAYAKCLLQYV